MNAAIYTRVSTADQGDNGTSLVSQVDRCKAYAAQHGFTVVRIIEDQHSGFDPVRPGMELVKRAAKDGEIDALICYDQDRFARGEDAYFALVAYLQSVCKIRIFFVTTGELDVDNRASKLMGVIASFFSGDEGRKIAERTKRGKLQSYADGRVLASGRALYGYASIARKGASQKDYTLDLTPVTDVPGLETPASAVVWIYNQYLAGASTIAIARQLNDLGIPPARGKRWEASSVYNILTNRAYTGEHIRNRTVYLPMHDDNGIPIRDTKGKIRRVISQRPQDEWIVIRRDDLQLVTLEAFDIVQTQLTSGAKKGKNPTREYMLNRRVTCMHGRRYSASSTTDNDNTYSYYTLPRRIVHDTCSCRPVRCDIVDNVVWGWIFALASDTEKVLTTYRQLQHNAIAENTEALTAVQNFATCITEAESELTYLLEEAREYRKDTRMREYYREQIKAQNAKIDALTRERNRIALPLEDSILSDAQIEGAVQFFESLSLNLDKWENAPINERKALVEALDLKVSIGVDENGMRYVDIIWCGVPERVCITATSS